MEMVWFVFGESEVFGEWGEFGGREVFRERESEVFGESEEFSTTDVEREIE